jgi:hypothetical protein
MKNGANMLEKGDRLTLDCLQGLSFSSIVQKIVVQD